MVVLGDLGEPAEGVAVAHGQVSQHFVVDLVAQPGHAAGPDDPEAVRFQVSESGSGYTWSGNSRMNQLTAWSNDPVSDRPGEVLYVRDEESGELWTPTAGAEATARLAMLLLALWPNLIASGGVGAFVVTTTPTRGEGHGRDGPDRRGAQ